MASGEQQRLISFFNGRGEYATEHPATVDEERDMLARTFVAGGTTDVATNYRIFGIIGMLYTLNRHHLFGHLQAIDLNENARELSIARSSEQLASLAKDTEADFGIGQRILF